MIFELHKISNLLRLFETQEHSFWGFVRKMLSFSLERWGHNSGHWFEVNFFGDLFRLDILLLKKNEIIKKLQDLMTIYEEKLKNLS
jgi:hypothetical protein